MSPVSTGTLTTTPLAGSATYTEPSWEQPSVDDLKAQSTWIVALSSSDQSGTLYVEQSNDGSTVKRSDCLMTGADAVGNQSAMLKVSLVYAYFRIKYANGATKQATFSLGRRLAQS